VSRDKLIQCIKLAEECNVLMPIDRREGFSRFTAVTSYPYQTGIRAGRPAQWRGPGGFLNVSIDDILRVR
jgi:hypothetical protein